MSASPDIFLSYSRDDQATARRFAEGLEAQGFSVWWDATLRTGESYDQVTEKALNEAKAVVVLWSAKSVNSRWVRAEATMADRNKTLAPVMIEGCQRPIMFELTQTADLSHWTGDARDKAWQSFVVDLRGFITKVKPDAAAEVNSAHTRRPAAGIPWHRERSFKVAIVAVSVVVAAALLNGYLRTPKTPAAPNVPVAAGEVVQSMPPTTPPVGPPDTDPRASVAVIPFANLTGDASKEYFSDGMAEELIDALAHIPGLKVPARTSSFAYKGHNTDIRKIAQDLDVGTILEGSVRSAGDRIRVTAQLVDAKSGYHLFSQSYDRKFADIFKLQDELAKSIVMALRESLTEEQAASAIQAPPTQDVEAYRLYLQAVTIANGTEQGFRHALTLLDQAIARDPKFSRAYAGRAAIRLTCLVIGYPLPNALVDALRDSAQALALDPKLAEALSVRAATQAMQGNWLDAETSHRQAIAADKTDGSILINYAISTLQSVGHLRKTLTTLQEAYRLAPGAVGNTIQLAAIYSLMGMDADAVKLADLAVEMGALTDVVPIPQIYANAATHAGRYADAAVHLAPTLSPAMRAAGGMDMLQLTSAARGDPTKRKAAVASLLSLQHKLAAGDIDVNLRKFFMSEFAEFGALDEAYEMANLSLDEYLRGGTVGNAWGFLWMAEMRPFRLDPRFQAFVTRLKLMDYWMQYGPPDGCDVTGGKLTCH